MQHHFAALDGKRFLLSDIAPDLSVNTDMHVPTLPACVAVVCFRLMRTFAKSVLFTLHSFATAHYFAGFNTDYSN